MSESNESILKKVLESMQAIDKKLGDAESSFDAVVKAWGNTGHIPISKKFVGKTARVIIKRSKKEEVAEKS
jgi:putative transposon-encoded protein